MKRKHEYVGVIDKDCFNCKNELVNVFFDYNDNDEIIKETGECRCCGTRIYEKNISEEFPITQDIDRDVPYICGANVTNSFKPTVKCPYCNSTNTKKISTLSRMGSFATFGFAGKKVGKQWHCNNCKSDF